MNIDVKILNKISASQIQQYIKSFITMIKWNLFQVWKDDSASTNPLKLYATIIKLSIKYTIITIDIEKASDKIQHPFRIKTLNRV